MDRVASVEMEMALCRYGICNLYVCMRTKTCMLQTLIRQPALLDFETCKPTLLDFNW